MTEERVRVTFEAPRDLRDRADAVADVLDASRSEFLTAALENHLAARANDESFAEVVREAFFDDRIDAADVATVLDATEAVRLLALRASMDREPPIPDAADVDTPTREAFYDGDPPTWDGQDRSRN